MLENDWVLAMTGYRPDLEFLERLGIRLGDDPARTPCYDPETFETNRPGLYLAGTVCGGLNTSRWFIENGRLHAPRIMEHIATGRVAEAPASTASTGKRRNNPKPCGLLDVPSG